MSIFEAYDAEFSALRQQITIDIEKLKDPDLEDGKTIEGLSKLLDGLFLQSNDLIKQMELEARTSPISSRKSSHERVMQYKKSLQTLKAEFQNVKSDCEKRLLLESSIHGSSKSDEQRQRLLNANDRLCCLQISLSHHRI